MNLTRTYSKKGDYGFENNEFDFSIFKVCGIGFSKGLWSVEGNHKNTGCKWPHEQIFKTKKEAMKYLYNSCN